MGPPRVFFRFTRFAVFVNSFFERRFEILRRRPAMGFPFVLLFRHLRCQLAYYTSSRDNTLCRRCRL